MRHRISLITAVVLLLFLALSLRLFHIQVSSHPLYAELAQKQHRGSETLKAKRGDVVSSNGRCLASSIECWSVYIDSLYVNDPEETLYVLKNVLSLSPAKAEEIWRGMAQRRRFIWVKRRVSLREAALLEELSVRGVFLRREYRRIYPLGKAAAQVLGFCGIDGYGLAGVELAYDEYLKGKDGHAVYERDALGHRIILPEHGYTEPVDGASVYLTIDSVIQSIVEEVADGLVERWSPRSVAIVVLEPRSGAVLALATRPVFDPNNPQNAEEEEFRNYAFGTVYEPGSTFKAITASALLEHKKVSPDEKVDCHKGEFRFGRRVLHDHKPHDILTFNYVIAKSSNIGTAQVALRLTEQQHYEAIRSFGFGTPTGIDLPGEQRGILRSPSKWSRYSQVSLAIGQEIGVTVMQMMRAFSAIVNGGWLVRPYVVERIETSSGEVVYEAEVRKERVLSEEVSQVMRQILALVVEDGTGRRARSSLYPIGGKTGTAQKLDKKSGGYSETDYVASFFGFAPVDAPRVVVGVVVDTPKGFSYFGGVVAAPAVKKVIEQTLMYLEVPQMRTKEGGDGE